VNVVVRGTVGGTGNVPVAQAPSPVFNKHRAASVIKRDATDTSSRRGAPALCASFQTEDAMCTAIGHALSSLYSSDAHRGALRPATQSSVHILRCQHPAGPLQVWLEA